MLSVNWSAWFVHDIVGYLMKKKILVGTGICSSTFYHENSDTTVEQCFIPIFLNAIRRDGLSRLVHRKVTCSMSYTLAADTLLDDNDGSNVVRSLK